MSSDPEIWRDVPRAPNGGHGRALPPFLAPPAPSLAGPLPPAWAASAPAPPSVSPAPDAPPAARALRSPFPLEAIEID